MSEPRCERVGAAPRGRAGRRGALAATGSVAAAVASSACCWLPLTLLAFGASAAGAGAFFERWRPYFAGGAIALLGVGFYLAYSRAGACTADGCCDSRSRRTLRLTRAALWVAAALVVAFVSFPKYVGGLLEAFGGAGAAPGAAATDANAVAWRFDVQGMTCEACAVTLRAELARVDGVVSAEVDYAGKSALVRSADPAVVDKVRDAAKRHGFAAAPVPQTPSPSANDGDTP